MSRTYIEWYATIEDEDVRNAAIANFHEQKQRKPTDIAKSLIQAIDYGFSWSDTPQGHAFWANVHANNGKRTPTKYVN